MASIPKIATLTVVKLDGSLGVSYPLNHEHTKVVMIGRDPSCDIRISLGQVSRNHARIDVEKDSSDKNCIWFTSLSKKQGTYLNRELLKPMEMIELHHDDEICIGSRAFRFFYMEGENPHKRIRHPMTPITIKSKPSKTPLSSILSPRTASSRRISFACSIEDVRVYTPHSKANEFIEVQVNSNEVPVASAQEEVSSKLTSEDQLHDQNGVIRESEQDMEVQPCMLKFEEATSSTSSHFEVSNNDTEPTFIDQHKDEVFVGEQYSNEANEAVPQYLQCSGDIAEAEQSNGMTREQEKHDVMTCGEDSEIIVAESNPLKRQRASSIDVPSKRVRRESKEIEQMEVFDQIADNDENNYPANVQSHVHEIQEKLQPLEESRAINQNSQESQISQDTKPNNQKDIKEEKVKVEKATNPESMIQTPRRSARIQRKLEQALSARKQQTQQTEAITRRTNRRKNKSIRV